MFPGPPNNQEFNRYFAMGQVGLEMVAPIVLGLALDHYLNWTPWGLVGGAVFGLGGGLAHLVYMANRIDAGEPPRRNQEPR